MATTPEQKQQRAFIFTLIIAAVTAILNTLTSSANFVNNGSVYPGTKTELVANPLPLPVAKQAAQLDRIEVKLDTLDDRVRTVEKRIKN